ncbi:MAG: hypothetical protein L0Z62_34205 [Gemmataceae bacterium]|nr:hypothetical protein [Gemmataceae bacterium]
MLLQSARTLGLLPWLVGVLAVGLALRGYHYLNNPPVWHDEAALIVNVLEKDYGELLGPLFYSEAGPPLFMWFLKATIPVLGDGTFALRLLPFLASCAALIAMAVLAVRLLPPVGALCFLVLFACSDRLLWHCCEAKPYAIDVLLAVGLLALFVKREESVPPRLFGLLVLLAILSPVLVFLSFPSCFLLGGAALALLPAVWRARSWRIWGVYGLFGLLLCGSFLALLLGPIHAQKNERMLNCWVHLFPPWDRPWLVPWMMVVRLTEVFRYASEPIGNVLSVLAVVGGVRLWREGRRRLLAFLLAPIGLAALAWLAGQYPLGAARVMVYAAPGALLLVAAGVQPVFDWLRRGETLARFALPALAGLLLIPVAQAAYRVVVPWARLEAAEPSALVLQRRQANEPVVGLRWEHAYYCRRLGPLYRALNRQPTEPPTLPPASPEGLPRGSGPDAVTRVWVVGEKDEGAQQSYLNSLGPPGAWRVTAKYEFKDSVVLYVERVADMGRGPGPPGR